MKTTVNIYTFRDAMIKKGWSYSGATMLFDYLENLEEDTGEELDFDPTSFNCDYSELYIEDALEEYGAEDIEELVDILGHDTIVVDYDDDIIVFASY